jgi:hypothetical protein
MSLTRSKVAKPPDCPRLSRPLRISARDRLTGSNSARDRFTGSNSARYRFRGSNSARYRLNDSDHARNRVSDRTEFTVEG